MARVGVLAEYGVGGVGGDPLGSVHGDRVAVGDVLPYVVAVEDDAGAVIESLRCQPVRFGVDRGDAPTVSVAHRVSFSRLVGGAT
jgi:hypothetical protein